MIKITSRVHRGQWVKIQWNPVITRSLFSQVLKQHGGQWATHISQFTQCTSPIFHNASLCNRNMHTCAHFWYKEALCGIFVLYSYYIDEINLKVSLVFDLCRRCLMCDVVLFRNAYKRNSTGTGTESFGSSCNTLYMTTFISLYMRIYVSYRGTKDMDI